VLPLLLDEPVELEPDEPDELEEAGDPYVRVSAGVGLFRGCAVRPVLPAPTLGW